MNTEITDIKQLKGWVCYDSDCQLCIHFAEKFNATLARHHFKLVPLQASWVREKLALNDGDLLAEMRLLKPDGEMLGGADALLEISRQFWWAWPVRQLGRIPVMMEVFRSAYRWVARNRTCVGGACNLAQGKASANRGSRALDILPLVILPAMALVCQTYLAPWVFMWVMAVAIYAGCKWLTYRLATRNCKPSRWLAWGYLFAWPGMNAAEFFDHTTRAAKPQFNEWLLAIGKTIFGGLLVWAVARTVLPMHPLLAAWIGMVGITFVLHFGLFHVMSMVWRNAGVKAPPVMQNPLVAKSLADFWGARWNTAFNELAFRFTFRPLRRWTTPGLAMLAVFGLSGLIHEVVISLPARGGYGLPTLYFLIQGLGLLAERSSIGCHLGLGKGLRGWMFTFLVTTGPVFWLFHPPFIHNVILPMLTAIGAT